MLGGRWEGVGVAKDEELNFEEDEASHSLGGAGEGGVDGEELSLLSDKHQRIGLAETVVAWVGLRQTPMDLCACEGPVCMCEHWARSVGTSIKGVALCDLLHLMALVDSL